MVFFPQEWLKKKKNYHKTYVELLETLNNHINVEKNEQNWRKN